MQLPRPGDQFGPYRIERELGHGGMGTVLLATDTGLDRRVALKVMWPHHASDDAFRQRFLREATTLARLDSQHITTIYDHGVHDGVLFITTQYVEGGDLGAHLDERGSLAAKDAALICAEVAGALDDAHRAGVVHRDVKPANILLRSADAASGAYLCDFGIAQTEEGHGLTMTGALSGTWSWLAPERVHGEPATPASDVYSLGCVLWACLNNGAAPYAGSDVDVAAAHVSAAVPRLPGADASTRRINNVLAKALAKHPSDRFKSAGAFREALLAVARSAGSSDDAPNAGASTPRLRIIAGVAALLLVGAAAVGVRHLVRDEPRPESDPGKTSAAGAARGELVPGDADGDGASDVTFTWDRGAGDVQRVTLAGTSKGFAPPVMTDKAPGDEFLADVDGDARLDSVMATLAGKVGRPDRPLSLEVTLGNGQSTTTQVTIPRSGRTVDFALGDFDGDGRDDLLVSTDPRAGHTELWVLAATDGGFADPVSWARGSGPGSPVANPLVPGDYDGDGDDDLAVEARLEPLAHVTPGERRVGLLLIRSTGSTFEAPGPMRHVPTDGADYDGRIAGNYTAADVDGDSRDEIVVTVTRYDDWNVATRVYRARGKRFDDGVGWGATRIITGIFDYATTAADVNRDGRDDLLRVIRGDGAKWRVDVLVSTGSNFEQPTRVTAFDCLESCEYRTSHVVRSFTNLP
ncbi:protein kinase domain-containing protein [Nocardioides jensenii]|uniref:protein kinase domain-containing protein n=1 Tax=Nocardioides jensenii TaxID=1843 RepID=UPI0008363D30|nr:protein kinase [Nocardioides jensenii]